MTFRIYTRKGDQGETGILGGSRLSKSAARIQALGAVDEANAALGLILASASPGTEAPRSGEEPREAILRTILGIQSTLFEIGAALASTDPNAGRELFLRETEELERTIDHYEETLPALTRFILPGGGELGAGLHWARTVARRAESLIVAALREEAQGSVPLEARIALVTWFNRLSDALFVLARAANQVEGVPETVWESQGGKRKQVGLPEENRSSD